jgi:hypothetical protein
VVEGDAAAAVLGQRRDGLAPQVAPGGIAVDEQERRRVARPFVDVVEADVGCLEVPRFERKRAQQIPVEPQTGHPAPAYSRSDSVAGRS